MAKIRWRGARLYLPNAEVEGYEMDGSEWDDFFPVDWGKGMADGVQEHRRIARMSSISKKKALSRRAQAM